MVAILGAVPASAQDRLWHFTWPNPDAGEPGEIREILVSADGREWIEGRRLTDLDLYFTGIPGGQVVAGGGRFVIWLERTPPDFVHTRVGVLETRAFRISRLPGEVAWATQLVGDPTMSRVFLVGPQAVTSIGVNLVPGTIWLPEPPGALLDWAVAAWGTFTWGDFFSAALANSSSWMRRVCLCSTCASCPTASTSRLCRCWRAGPCWYSAVL
jgi:hypothetical protein